MRYSLPQSLTGQKGAATVTKKSIQNGNIKPLSRSRPSVEPSSQGKSMNEPTLNDTRLPGSERSPKRTGDAKIGPAGKRLMDECHEMLDRLDPDQLETIRALMEIFLRPARK